MRVRIRRFGWLRLWGKFGYSHSVVVAGIETKLHGHRRVTPSSADVAWVKHAARCGMTIQQIKDELLNGRDLSKKGNRKRQLEYAECRPARRLSRSGAVPNR
jgi:hypothetical protein